MKTTRIEWTDKTWNPVTGCTKVSPGCRHCYAETMALRFQELGYKKYARGFALTLHESALNEPLRWKGRCCIFGCSMGDLFHRDVPDAFLDRIFDVVRATPWHRYQLLTKRPERMAEYFASREVPRNVWLGTTVEARVTVTRIDVLRGIKAPVRFLSCEPLLEDLGELDLAGIHWVVVGGESGEGARPMKEEWVLSLKRCCEDQGVAFYFKQWGTWTSEGVKGHKKQNGAMLQGRLWRQMPEIEEANDEDEQMLLF